MATLEFISQDLPANQPHDFQIKNPLGVVVEIIDVWGTKIIAHNVSRLQWDPATGQVMLASTMHQETYQRDLGFVKSVWVAFDVFPMDGFLTVSHTLQAI